MELGKLGVFSYLDTLDAAQAAEFARALERMGYGALWFPETFGRDPFVCAAHVLGATEQLVAGAAVAIIWKRAAAAMAGAAHTIAEMFPDRFVLGMGVSGGPFMKRHGLDYGRPLSAMREYLAAMRAAPYYGPRPGEEPPLMLAALRPKMLELAARETTGTITALMPPEAIARVRAALGPDTRICAQQVVMLESDAALARAAARKFLHFYLGSPTYHTHLRALGFTDNDLGGDGSDRLVDALVVWGDTAKLRRCLDDHLAAGANHVIVNAIGSTGGHRPDLRALEALAPR
ncbi:MAG TPA: TIGR03620 family F420-dependent LLM class oxidoreductase [Candidatus Binataceae bacterium]|jgi:probable F420-dependent oxidoreductase|nr:TIGR03620 family F420-dependent LLM class oxidoreductase [Candidatus Binataceae bacterium]